jgi:deazaflavin-dependent oxidoreductase (nitroreductase family)
MRRVQNPQFWLAMPAAARARVAYGRGQEMRLACGCERAEGQCQDGPRALLSGPVTGKTGLDAGQAGKAGAMTFPRAFARCTHGVVNQMTLHLAGHAAFADLEHVGRKSGIVRHTPVRAFRSGDTVTIGLNFGRQSDWYQNIKAAGTCRIRMSGGHLTLGAPVLVPAGQATRNMPWLFGLALRRLVHTAECVQLPVLH